MDSIEWVGIFASIFTGIALLPQLIKIFREKTAEGTSWLMLGCLFLGLSLWVIYGALRKDPIIVISNCFAWAVNLTVAVLSFVYRNNKSPKTSTGAGKKD